MENLNAFFAMQLQYLVMFSVVIDIPYFSSCLFMISSNWIFVTAFLARLKKTFIEFLSLLWVFVGCDLITL